MNCEASKLPNTRATYQTRELSRVQACSRSLMGNSDVPGLPAPSLRVRCQLLNRRADRVAAVRAASGPFAGRELWLACIDLHPNSTTQTPKRSDILNVVGFRNVVFGVNAVFLNDDANRFVAEAETATL